MHSEEEQKQHLFSNFIQEFCVSHVILAELSINIKAIGQVRESNKQKFKVRHGSKFFFHGLILTNQIDIAILKEYISSLHII